MALERSPCLGLRWLNGIDAGYPGEPTGLSAATATAARVGFPLARIAAFFSLQCGAVLDLGICSYSGKGHSELGMLRQLWDLLRPGDILLADRYMCAWHEIYLLKQRGIDTVTRVHHCRRVDFRRGKRLGKDDHIVEWCRPGRIRSIDWPTLKSLPDCSRFVKRVCEFSSPASAAEAWSLSQRYWMVRM